MKKTIKHYLLAGAVILFAAGCQKMDRPEKGDYPRDSNPPGGALKFYAAFDGTTTDSRMNAVDSIRATFPSDNPLTNVDGVSGKALQGENKKFVKYAKPNDWAKFSESFTISTWYKRNGQTQNNTLTNGPEYLMSFKSNSTHWSGASMLLFLEGDNAACAVKVMIADKNNADNWFTWEGGGSIPGLLNNNWHHLAVTYNSSSSTMVLYIDGVANASTKVWGAHGPINIDDATITEFRIGAGPGTSYDTNDWLSSTFKGQIDQVRMYNVALSASEVAALHTARK